MALSARNQIVGKSIATDQFLAEVVVTLGDGQEIVSVIMPTSVHRLKLEPGKQVKVVMKATEVMLLTDD